MILSAVRFERRDNGAFGRRVTAEADACQEQVREEDEGVRGDDRLRQLTRMSFRGPVQLAGETRIEIRLKMKIPGSVQIIWKSPVTRAFLLDTERYSDIVSTLREYIITNTTDVFEFHRESVG